jgi:hypothetical protein
LVPQSLGQPGIELGSGLGLVDPDPQEVNIDQTLFPTQYLIIILKRLQTGSGNVLTGP